ncbi:hypothetical protein CR513_25273, partial [Mucuna pruriens]
MTLARGRHGTHPNRTSTRSRETKFLQNNANIFAWKLANMPEPGPNLTSHYLAVNTSVCPVSHKRRRMNLKNWCEKSNTPRGYPTWFSSRNSQVKWRMYVEYTDINKHCPKDYPLPNIDQLVYVSSGFQLLSFMDAY